MAQTTPTQWSMVQFPNLPESSDPALRDAIQLLFKGLKDHVDAIKVLSGQVGTLQNQPKAPVSQGGGVTGVTAGGTGAQSLLTNGVLIGQGANPVQAAAPGTGADVLTSNGPGVNPSFQSPLYSELLVDQTGTPILAQLTAGGFDIIMTVQQL